MRGGWGGQHCFVLFHLFIFCSELFSSRLLSHWGVLWSVLRVADGATAELRGRRRPLPEASEPAGREALWSWWEARHSLPSGWGSVPYFGSSLDQTFASLTGSTENTSRQSVYLPSEKSTSPSQQPPTQPRIKPHTRSALQSQPLKHIHIWSYFYLPCALPRSWHHAVSCPLGLPGAPVRQTPNCPGVRRAPGAGWLTEITPNIERLGSDGLAAVGLLGSQCRNREDARMLTECLDPHSTGHVLLWSSGMGVAGGLAAPKMFA